jgi:hypothetical protein
MKHPSDDELLLLAYGELPEAAATVDAHVSGCATCRGQLAALERSRVALEVALPKPRRPAVAWATLGLAAAALLLGVLVTKSNSSRDVREGWSPTTTWSATAGYVAGGSTLMEIDAQLTRLEQERYYGSRQ